MARRVLIVDDDVVVLRAVQEVLTAAEGWELALATSGREALTKAREFQPDTVVLDLGLPDMDGIDVCRALKQPGGRDGPKVVVLTGQTSPQLPAAVLAAGADDCLFKPVSPHVLRRALRR